MDWMIQGSNCGRVKNFYLLQIDHSPSENHLANYLMGRGVLMRDLRCWDIKLTTDVFIVLRLVWSYASTPPIRLHDMGIMTHYGLHGLRIESQCGQ